MNAPNRLTRIIAVLSIALAMFGVVMVYSSSAFQTKPRPMAVSTASDNDPDPAQPALLPLLPRTHWGRYSTLGFFAKQMLWAALGVLALLATSRIDYPRWRCLARPLLLGAFAALLMVWSPLGGARHGATSWLYFRWFTIQPAEFAKLALVIFLADVFARKQSTLESSFFRSLALLAIPVLMVLLVVLQPDLGMATLMLLLTAGICFLAGARLRHLLLVATAGVLLLTAVLYHNPNARRRIETYVFPEKASENSRYQIYQAQVGMAKGRLWGVGLGDGQQKLRFLPAPHTDFIFAVVAEELGFVVSLGLLLIYGLLICAGFSVALRTPDLFATLLAGGLSLMLALGVLINVAVVTGCIPTTGLPLPLLSYGGSSLLSSMIALGIIINVSKNVGGVPKS